jgi:hypothetical protein
MTSTGVRVVTLVLLFGGAPGVGQFGPFVAGAAAQSVTASVFGTVSDEQRGVLPGATVTVKDLGTGQLRSTTTTDTGTFRIVGLAPGRHEVTIELEGFRPHVAAVELSVGEELEMNPTLQIGRLAETTTVVADAGERVMTRALEIALGRTISTRQIDELPVANRDFTTLALLSPGILENHSSGLGSSAGIEAAGLTGRSAGFVLDGLTLDDMQASNVRGTVSLDAVQEFLVLSNGFAAEYGQAAGAMVSILTRSGTNRFAGRAAYYHRDDAWDATPASARLVTPPLTKTSLAQKVLSGFLGGPIRRDRFFFFASAENMLRDTENITTSPVLSVFHPGAPTHEPVYNRKPLVLGRGDANLSASDSLMVRYRLSFGSTSPWFNGSNPGQLAHERAADSRDRNQDAAMTHTHVWGAHRLNEFRFQFARRFFDVEPTRSCPGCPPDGPQVDRPSIALGRSADLPNSLVENRWQVADSVIWLHSGPLGDHAVKAGIDASAVGVDWDQLINGGGTFQFLTNQPFDPAIAATYPSTYKQTTGNPLTREETKLVALFTQDEWKLPSQVTLNLGVRWDYQDAPGVSHELGKVAPRLGVAWVPGKTGRTQLRGSYGLYYDQVFLRMARDADQARTIIQTQINNPGYPDPFGYNPLRTAGLVTPVQNTTRLADNLLAPYTSQATAGIRREIGSNMAISADGVLARGYNLFLTHDLNYPDPTDPKQRRPDPDFLQVNEVQSRGHSWYNALQVGVEKRHTHGYSFTAAYTLASSQRDTEDFNFVAQDQRNEAAERGPSAGDARHRLAASVNLDLPYGLRLTAVTTTQSALPYNITTGARDVEGTPNIVRPPGVGRNSARGTAFWQTNARLAKTFRIQSRQVELLAEAFNVTNRANWMAYDGRQNSATYHQPTGSGDPRQVQVGVRVDF